MKRSHWFLVLAMSMASSGLRGSESVWPDLADPVIEDGWIRPRGGENGANCPRPKPDPRWWFAFPPVNWTC